MSRHGYTLTAEQQAILRTLPPPSVGWNSKGKLIRITAAAGAGKTTTLLELAEAAAAQHDIVYLTFAKAAAKDGMERFRERPGLRQKIDARTLHSAAHRLVQQAQLEPQGVYDDSRMWNDVEIKNWIDRTCEVEIDDFLAPCYAELSRRSGDDIRSRIEAAREQVIFFIFKSLQLFCHSKFSVSEYKAVGTRVPFGRDYYVAVIFHSEKSKGEAYGFRREYYQSRVKFYAEQAIRLWELVQPEGRRAYDFDMKRVQLEQLHVKCSLLLVDECQDMDACQIDWIQQHTSLGTHVYLVGDPAQAIYHFRGARPKFLQELSADFDMKLTESFRFGTAVTNVANVVLFAKEHSDQTKMQGGRHVNWTPYRVKTGTSRVSCVTSDSLLPQWRVKKTTLIGRSNISLLLEALRLMGLDMGEEDEQSFSPPPSNDEPVFVINPANIPKIYMNGRGESSGLKLWKKTIEMVKAVYDLRISSQPLRLDRALFPDFRGKTLSWDQFVDEIANKELTKYAMAVEVVKRCKAKTVAAIDAFQEHVVDRSYGVSEADIILTTCHSAKGMEWDNVQLCDDFIDLSTFKKERDTQLNAGDSMSPTKRPKFGDKWSFAFKAWDDDLNLLYVASTRAKMNLCIPKQLRRLIRLLDSAVAARDVVSQGGSLLSFSIPGASDSKPLELSVEELASFVDRLVQPLRNELRAPHNQSLWSVLIADSDIEPVKVELPQIVTPHGTA